MSRHTPPVNAKRQCWREIGVRLHEAREESDYSRIRVAGMLGKPESFLASLEKNASVANVRTLTFLAVIYAVELDWVLGPLRDRIADELKGA
ncbi:MAG: helix-turn-helix transcriptional regulator [Candidatus Eisenbacteria sp.]|nr:helix-turn-helix transcriptional regulator [Candidatus Eisenbacteria bacterium]